MHEPRASVLATQAGSGQQNSAANILRAAAVEFDRLGFGTASFASVAERANVSKSLVSYHFPTKALLAGGVIALAYQGGAFMTDAGGIFDGLSSIAAAAMGIAEALIHDPLARAAVRLRLEPEVRAMDIPSPYTGWLVRIHDTLSRAQRNAELSRSLDVGREARLLVSTFVGLANVATATGEVFNLADDIGFAINSRIATMRGLRRSNNNVHSLEVKTVRGMGMQGV